MEISYTPDFFIGPVMIETKGWKTPDFKLKEKMFYKYLKENEPEAIYYIVKNQKQLLEVLDNHWSYLEMAVQVISKGSKKQPSVTMVYDSIMQAMEGLGIKEKPIGSIIRSLTGKTQWVYGYNWKLVKT